MNSIKMKKQNMDHIKERFEHETGVNLPEKEGFEMPAWTGRIVAAAAGLICLAGLGLVWHKVSADKQLSSEQQSSFLLSDGEEEVEEVTTIEKEETVEIDESTAEEGLRIENSDSSTMVSLTTEAGGSENAPADSSVSVYTSDDYSIAFYDRNAAEKLVDVAVFGEDGEWIWPVPDSARSDALLCTAPADSINLDCPSPYLSIPGTVGDKVVAMHACTVKETGFDNEKGNFVTTEVNGNTIEYRHLDTISVSAGDTVAMGAKIGTLGNSGASTGPHLGIIVTAADGTVLNIISVPAYNGSFYKEEIIED